MNKAARLCSSAAAGQVLVTRGVRELVGETGDVVFAERGSSTFKGFDEPVEVIEALAVARHGGSPKPVDDAAAIVQAEDSLQPELDPMTPLVDREHEMRWLRGTWRQARRGHGRVLFVTGPAQIGKTRLAAELARYVEGNGGEVRYAGPGGAATALALAQVRGVSSIEAPTLVVLDDLDVAGPSVSQALARSLADVGSRSVGSSFSAIQATPAR